MKLNSMMGAMALVTSVANAALAAGTDSAMAAASKHVMRKGLDLDGGGIFTSISTGVPVDGASGHLDDMRTFGDQTGQRGLTTVGNGIDAINGGGGMTTPVNVAGHVSSFLDTTAANAKLLDHRPGDDAFPAPA